MKIWNLSQNIENKTGEFRVTETLKQKGEEGGWKIRDAVNVTANDNAKASRTGLARLAMKYLVLTEETWREGLTEKERRVITWRHQAGEDVSHCSVQLLCSLVSQNIAAATGQWPENVIAKTSKWHCHCQSNKGSNNAESVDSQTCVKPRE